MHPVDWTYSAGLNPGADTHESVSETTHSVTSSQTKALRRNMIGLILFDILPDIARLSNCLKRNFAVNQNLNYGTLLKIMVELSHNVNRAQTVFHALHTINYWRFTTQVISQRETLPCVMMPTKYKRRNENH